MLLKRSKWKPLAKLIDSLISSCNDIDSSCSSNVNLEAWVSDHKDKNSKKDPSIDCCDGNQIETEDANIDTNNNNNTGAQHQNNEQHCYDIFKSIRNHQHDHSGILHHLLRNFAPSEIILDLIHQFPYLVYDIDDYGISPLHIAAACGLPPLFSKALLKCYPESALLQDRFGRTPLIATCQSQSSGMDPEIPYTPSGVQYSVDFWIHHQIVVLLLSVPLNGIAMEDSCGYNALEYTIMGHGPMSVVQVLQSKLAIERHVLSELKNTKKRTKLPVLPVEPLYYFCDGDGTGFGHGKDAEDEAVYDNNGHGYGGEKPAQIIHRTHSQDHKYTYSSSRQISNHECEFEKGWRPIMMTYRDTDFHNPKRIQIHSRLQSMELECDGLSQEKHNCMRYRKGLRAFLGTKDCDDSVIDDADEIAYNPFKMDIPLVIDVVHDVVVHDNCDCKWHRHCDADHQNECGLDSGRHEHVNGNEAENENEKEKLDAHEKHERESEHDHDNLNKVVRNIATPKNVTQEVQQILTKPRTASTIRTMNVEKQRLLEEKQAPGVLEDEVSIQSDNSGNGAGVKGRNSNSEDKRDGKHTHQ